MTAYAASGHAAQDQVPEDKLYTYVIVRGDLDMSPGKLAAQATHAARVSLLRYIQNHPDRLDEFVQLGSCGSVVVLHAKGLPQIEAVQAQAIMAALPTALFTDSGHVMMPHFDGTPVTTALAIGPAPREAMRRFTKKFQCVR